MDETTDTPDISGSQTLALAALLAGSTVTEAAEKAGVARKTVSEWRNHHEAFRHALEDGRAEIADHVRGRAMTLYSAALDVLSEIMRNGKEDRARIQAAARILDLVPPGGFPPECQESADERDNRRRSERVYAMVRRR